MAQYLPLPDGSSVTIREGETPQQAWARAQQMYPEAFRKAQPVKEEGTAPSSFKDIATAFGLGATGSVKALTDVFGADNVASQGLDKASEALSRAYTPQRQAEIERRQKLIKEAEKSGSTWEEIKANLGAVAEAPLQSAAQGLGSIVPYAVTGGAGAAAKLLPSTVRTINMFMGAAQGAGAVKGSIYDAVYDRLKQEGADEATAKQQAVEAQNYIGANFGQIGLGAGIGAAAGRFGVESLLAPGAAKTAAPGVGRRVGTALLSEMPLEGVQGGQERLAANLALQNQGFEVPTFQGVAGQAAQEAAMAGLAAGPVAAVRSPREEMQRKEAEAAKLAAEERQAAAKAEGEKRAKPDYALDLEKRYLAAEQQRRDLKAQLLKIDEDSPTVAADKAHNKALEKQIEDLGKNTIAPLAKEYAKVRPVLNQIRKDEELAKMAPEDFMLQHVGVAPPVTPTPKAPPREIINEFGQIVPAPEETTAVNPVQSYAQGQVDAARQSGQLDLDTMADYLMQNPQQAALVARQRPALQGFSKAELSSLYGLHLKNKLKTAEATRTAETKQTFEQRAADLSAPPLPEDEQKYGEVIKFAQESKKLAEEGDRSLDPLFASAIVDRAPVIQVSDDVKAFREKGAAQRVRSTVENLLVTADKADNDYAQALSAREPAAAKAAFERGNAALEQIKTMEAQGGEYTKAFLAARQAQNNALAKLEDVADKLRTGETIGGRRGEMASGTAQTLTNQAAELRSQFITAALQEAALHRRAEGKPALTQDEAIKAASQMYDTLNEWVDRVQKEPQRTTMESVLVEPAQMRAHKLIRQARYEQRRVFDSRPLEQYRFGAYPQAVAVLKDQLNETRRALGETPAKATREEQLLKQQFAPTEAKKVAEAKGETATTLGGELRRHSEYTLTNLNKALALPDLPQGGIYEGIERGQPYVYRVEDMRELLEKARDVIEDGKASRDLLDAVDAQVARLLRGEDRNEMLVRAKEVASEKRVVRNVPGKEGSTEFGTRRTMRETTREEERAPLLEYQQDIKDALAAAAPTALEQKAAGQKQLFPETEEDLGYIRMSPKNFANSPKIRTAWEALDKARAIQAKAAAEKKVKDARTAAGIKTIERLEAAMDNIKKDTKFFWANEPKWSNESLAKAFVPYPDITTDPEEKTLLNRFLKREKLTPDEQHRVFEIERRYREKTFPEYKQKLDEAMKMLAQGNRLDAVDNQLFTLMQDKNEAVRSAAKGLSDRIGVMKQAIVDIKRVLRASAVISPEQKALLDKEADVSKARGDYQQAVEKAMAASLREMDAALAELLDPDIEATTKALKEAQDTLAKEKAELEKINGRVQEVLAQPEGKDRMQLATYQQFRFEEKKAIIDDLEAKIKEQQDDLSNLMETRYEEFDGAQVAAQAMLDKNVRQELNYLEMMEAQLAGMRGEDVLQRPNAYPFASRRAELNMASQKQAVEAAQKRADEFKDKVEKAKTKIKKTPSMAELPRTVVAQGRVVETEEDRRADKLREEAINKTMEVEEIQRKAILRQLMRESLQDELEEATMDFAGMPGPTTAEELNMAMVEEGVKRADKAFYKNKLALLNQITSLNAQIDALEEGKPVRKQRAATVETTAAQAARKPFRSASDEARAARRAAEAEGEGSKRRARALEEVQFEEADVAPPEDLTGYDFLPLQERFEFSRGTPMRGLTAKTLQKELERGLGEKLLIGTEEFQGNRRLAIYDTPEEFMAANPQYKGQIPSDAKGFVDEGKATLFANNIGEGHGLGVLLHEVGVHIGFRNFFNQAQYNALVNTVKSWASKTDNSIEAKIGKAAMQRVEAANTPKNQVDDELLAYAVEEAMTMGVRPDGVGPRSVAQNWLRMVVDAFKRALSKFGINPSKLTAGDLVNFAYGCAQLELKGTWHGAGVKFDQFDHAYMGSGEGAQAFGWGTYRAQRMGIAENYRNVAARNTNDRQEREWLENPEVQAWINQQAPKIKGASLSEISDYAAEGKEGDVQYGIPYKYSGILSYALANANDMQFEGKFAGVDPQQHLRDFVKTFADDMIVNGEYYQYSYPEMYEGAGIEKNVADLRKFIDKFDGLEVPEKKEPPIPEPKPVQGTLKRTLHLRPEYEYLALDVPADKQSKYVLDRIQEMFDGFDDAHQQAFLRSLSFIPNPKFPRGKDVYNALSAAYELDTPDNPRKADQIASEKLLEAGVAGNKFLDRFSRESYGTYNYVDFGDKEQGAAIMGTDLEPVGTLKKGDLLFSRNPTYANDDWADFGKKSEAYIAKNKGTIDRVRAAAGGFLGLETQLVDRFAGFERISKVMEPLKGSQMMYYLRMYDQRMNFVSQAVGNGALGITEKERADGKKEFIIESKEGPSIKGVVDILKGAKPFIGNGEAVNRMFTMYLSAIRGERVGFDKLNFGSETTEADLNGVRRKVENDPALKEIFDLARNEYNAYNRNMVEFVVNTGALSEQVGAELTSENDYIPFYRERNGAAELLIGDAAPIRIGSIAEQPYLHELIGGDKPIMDFMVSSVQNTNMLAEMGLRNLATKNAVFELVDLDMAKIVGKTEGPNVVKFKVDGEDRYADVAGTKEIPGDLLVKGMEGIPTQMPFIWRAMSVPSRLLRKAVTASPLYAARQLFRDSVAAPLLTGADFTPVMGALRQIGKPTKETLERRGVVGGQQFTGTAEDLTTILRQISDGQSGWMQALAKAEAIGMEADALTRRAQYNSYIEQGLSEMESTLMALESMNFSKRGADPSVHIVGALIPFFNAQIQALNVLYKSFTGKMPFNDKLKIQEKLLKRGALLAGATMVYAAMMQDDEAYKNATPDQKYGNWFVRIPGVDEPVRIPVPFEVGYIFKALPEAMYNSMVNEHGGDEAVKAFQQILLQTIPGGTSYGLPQAIKPAIEAGLGKSFYTGRDILSQHEKMLLPEEQFRANTTEMAKLVGKIGISPIVFESLVQGYTGTMGMAFLQALSAGVPTGDTPEQAVRRLSETPVVGGAFQPNDAGGIINDTYDRMTELKKVKTTIDDMMESGRTAEAKALLEKRINEYVAADMADDFTRDMRDITQLERAVRAAPTMTPQEKRAKLDELRKLKIVLAESTRRAAGQIVRPSDLP